MTQAKETPVLIHRFFQFLLQVLIGIVISEVIFQIWGGDFNLSPNWKYHPVLGWSQVPNLKLKYKSGNEIVSIRFNSLGFRDIEHKKKKPLGVKRIVVIGDSISEALQVDLEDTYFRTLERNLNNSSDQKWEIINLGVGDFGTTQEWIALKEFGLAYEPDLVILQILPLNDICNNSIQLFDACGSPNDRYRPYFEQSNGELRVTLVQPRRTWLRKHIKTYGLIERAAYEVKRLVSRKSLEQLRDQKRKELGYVELPQLYTYAPENQQIPPIVYGWKLTERAFEHVAEACKRRNIKLLVMVVPFEACVGNKNWSNFHKQKAGTFELIKDYPEKRLQSFFDRAGITSVMLLDVFENHLNEVLPYRDGHLNPAGHHLAALELYEKIKEMNVDPTIK